MSKNISIAEGGVARQFTNDKLKINLFSGGTEYYVPESSVQLTTKSVTQNGTYKASDVGKYGFSQVSVNVKGGNGSAGSDGKPTYTPPSGSTPASGVEPGGSGSAVVGTDPTTGNEEVVGVDNSGNLVTTPLPSSIVLVTNPTKMSYNDGEAIDLSGAVVVAKNADGTTWTDADHPNGHVSCAPEPETASSSGGPTDWSVRNPAYYVSGDGTVLGQAGNRTYIKSGTGPAVCAFGAGFGIISAGYYQSTWFGPILLATEPENAFYISPGSDGHYGPDIEISYGGLTWYLSRGYHGYNVQYNTQFPTVGGVYDTWQSIANAILSSAGVSTSGGGGGTQDISLNWARPGDGKVLSTTMEISVSGSSSTEDDEGGGGGHSF